ncbi:hypothetical protein P9112_000263 [Eukaryota sp. TZLM1-RC]
MDLINKDAHVYSLSYSHETFCVLENSHSLARVSGDLVGHSLRKLNPILESGHSTTFCSLLHNKPLIWNHICSTEDQTVMVGNDPFIHHLMEEDVYPVLFCKQCHISWIDSTFLHQFDENKRTNIQHQVASMIEKASQKSTSSYFSIGEFDPHPTHFHLRVQRNTHGAVIGYIRVRQVVFEGADLMRQILDEIPFSIGIHCSPSKIEFMNRQMRETVGVSSPTCSLYDFLDRETAERSERENIALWELADSVNKHSLSRLKSGKTIPVSFKKVPLPPDHPTILLFNITDNPETQKVREDLFSTELRMWRFKEALSEVSFVANIAIILYNKDSIFCMNEKMRELFCDQAFCTEEMETTKILNIVCNSFMDDAPIRVLMELDLDSPRILHITRALLKDGRTVDVLSFPLSDELERTRALCITDISERVLKEHELTAALESAKVSKRAKQQLLALFSHELKTPISSILTNTELIMETMTTETVKENVKAIQDASHILENLISNMLETVEVETSSVIPPAEFNLVSLVDSIYDMYRERTSQNVLFSEVIHPCLDDNFIGLERAVKTIVLNLVANAVKFTDSGTIKLGLSCLHQLAEKVHIRFELTDTGIGMSPQLMANVFEPFEVEDPQKTVQGAGLGLYLSQKMADKLKTKINVESTEGRGSRFWFDFELTRARHPPTRRTYLSACCNIKIVLAGDTTCFLVQNLVEQLRLFTCDVDVFTEDNPVAFRNYLHSLSPTNVLIDVRMSLILSAVSCLPVSRLLLIIQNKGEMQLSCTTISSGEFLLLPTTYYTLLRKLLAWAQQPSVSHVEEQLAVGNLTVMVVDDSILNLRSVSKLLTLMGVKVLTASSGPEAIAVYKTNHQQISLILMDYRMKPLNGVETSQQIRLLEQTKSLPRTDIIALTADLSISTVQDCLSIMQDFLPKPVTKQKLITILNKYLSG